MAGVTSRAPMAAVSSSLLTRSFSGFWQNVKSEWNFSLNSLNAPGVNDWQVLCPALAICWSFNVFLFCYGIVKQWEVTKNVVNDAESSCLCFNRHIFWHHSSWSLTSPTFSSCRHPFIHADIRAIHSSTADPRSPRHLFISACARGAGCSRHNLYLPVTAWITDHSLIPAADHRTPHDLGSRPRPHRPHRPHTPGGPGSAQCWRWRWGKQVRVDLLPAGIYCNYRFVYL